MTVEGIAGFTSSLSSLPSQVSSGVKTTDELNYIKAMVWDLGYVTRTIKPGPKTMWSVNVRHESKVLTITAPTGFIRIQRNEYIAILRDEFKKAQFATAPISKWQTLIEAMMKNAAERSAAVVAGAAPIDTGELRESIVAAPPGDSALTNGNSGAYTWDEPFFDIGSWL